MSTLAHRIGIGRRRLRVERELGGAIGGLAPLIAFLGVFFVAPLVVFFAYSLWRTSNFQIIHDWTLQSYADVFTSAPERKLIWNTLQIAGAVSVLTTLIAYSFAHVLRFHLTRWQEPLLFLVLIALFSGYLVRIYAWRTILGSEGIINTSLQKAGLTDDPLTFLLYSKPAAIIVLTNFLVPLAILPIYAGLQTVRNQDVEAARDLGCGALRAHSRVTLPLAWSGIFAGWALAFIIAAGDYVTPQMVGGTDGAMIGTFVANDFGNSFNWSHGAALSFVTLAIVLGITITVQRLGRWMLAR